MRKDWILDIWVDSLRVSVISKLVLLYSRLFIGVCAGQH